MGRAESLEGTGGSSRPSCSSASPTRRALEVPACQLLLIVLVLVMPATLPALAYASPPDASSIYGIYDGADHDDVVTRVLSSSGSLGPDVPTDLLAIPLLLGTPPQSADRAPVTFSAPAVRPRAPPVSRPPGPASSPVI